MVEVTAGTVEQRRELPFDLRQAVIDPTPGHVLLAMANAAALAVLVLLLRGWLPGRPSPVRTNRR